MGVQKSEIVRKSDVEDDYTQTPAIENITGAESLRDILSFMKRSKNFFILGEKDNGDAFWNVVFVQPLRERRINIENQEFDITPVFQAFLTNTRVTTKLSNNVEKETVFYILENVGFYDNIPEKVLKSARIKDALFYLPRELANIRNPLIPQIVNEEVFHDLQGERKENVIIPFNMIDIYTKMKILLELKLSRHSNTLAEASNLID